MYSRLLILTTPFIELEYTIYLHKTTLSKNEEQRHSADYNIQLAMGMEMEKVRAYSKRSGVCMWRVIVV